MSGSFEPDGMRDASPKVPIIRMGREAVSIDCVAGVDGNQDHNRGAD